MTKNTAIALIILFLIVGAGIGYYFGYDSGFERGVVGPIVGEENDDDDNGGGSVFCTLDAMFCPDGSFVGRIPPSCNFALCPRATTTPTTTPSR